MTVLLLQLQIFALLRAKPLRLVITVEVGSDAFHVVESVVLFRRSVFFELIQLRDQSHGVLRLFAFSRLAANRQQKLTRFVDPSLAL